MTVSGKHLSTVLGITSRHVNRLASDGVLDRDDDGFDLEGSVRKYCEHLRSDAEVRAERRKLIEAQVSATRLRAQRQTGDLLTRKEVRRRLESFEIKLLDLRGAAGGLYQQLDGIVDEPTRMRLAYGVHNTLCAMIQEIRQSLAATFADAKQEQLEVGLERLGLDRKPAKRKAKRRG